MVKRSTYGCLAFLMVQAIFFTGMVYGFDKAHLQKLNSTNQCEK